MWVIEYLERLLEFGNCYSGHASAGSKKTFFLSKKRNLLIKKKAVVKKKFSEKKKTFVMNERLSKKKMFVKKRLSEKNVSQKWKRQNLRKGVWLYEVGTC